MTGFNNCIRSFWHFLLPLQFEASLQFGAILPEFLLYVVIPLPPSLDPLKLPDTFDSHANLFPFPLISPFLYGFLRSVKLPYNALCDFQFDLLDLLGVHFLNCRTDELLVDCFIMEGACVQDIHHLLHSKSVLVLQVFTQKFFPLKGLRLLEFARKLLAGNSLILTLTNGFATTEMLAVTSFELSF